MTGCGALSVRLASQAVMRESKNYGIMERFPPLSTQGMAFLKILLALLLSLGFNTLWSGFLSPRLSRRDPSIPIDTHASFPGPRTILIVNIVAILLIIRSLWNMEGLWEQLRNLRDVGFLLLCVLTFIGLWGVILPRWRTGIALTVLLFLAWIADRNYLHLSIVQTAWTFLRRGNVPLLLLSAIAAAGGFSLISDLWRRRLNARVRFSFAFAASSIITGILILARTELAGAHARQDPFILALALTSIVVAWKLLFSPGQAGVKTTLIAVAIFWLEYASLRGQSLFEIQIYALALFLSCLPALILCGLLILRDRSRTAIVLLCFLGGILSAAPIVLYNLLAERGSDVNFFLATVHFSGIPTSVSLFLNRGAFSGLTAVQTTLTASFLVYLFVALVEEGSKGWMLSRANAPFARSLPELLGMAILVAMGFSAAENIVNPALFIDAVRNFLMTPDGANLAHLTATFLGRSFLITLVHVFGTAVLAYHLGMAIFASPRLREQFTNKRLHPILSMLHDTLTVQSDATFRRILFFKGILCAVLFHAAFNFSMSLLDLLPLPAVALPAFLRTATSILPGSDASGVIALFCTLYIAGGIGLVLLLFASARRMHANGDLQAKTELAAPRQKGWTLDALFVEKLDGGKAIA